MSYDQRWHRGLVLTGINLNSAGSDNAIAFPAGIAKWRSTKLTIYDVSTSLAVSIATLGLYTSTGGGGSTLVTAATMTALTGATVCLDMTLLLTTAYQTATTIYLRNVTAHGSAATCSASFQWEWLG